MGETATDLPDPLDQNAPDAAPLTDDLLAQMASDEIDRLLSEADVPASSSSAPSALAAQEELDAATAQQLDELYQELNQAQEKTELPARSAPTAATVPPAADKEDSELARQLDDLFAQLNGAPPEEASAAKAPAVTAPADPAPVIEASPAASAAPVVETTAVAAAPGDASSTGEVAEVLSSLKDLAEEEPAPSTPVAGAVDPAEQTGSLERQVLQTNLALAEENEPAGSADVPAVEADDRLPWYFRPLEWLNAPIEGCSAALREVLAKAAIATILFSLIVLTYVSVFRGR